jgi:hypothetical protein
MFFWDHLPIFVAVLIVLLIFTVKMMGIKGYNVRVKFLSKIKIGGVFKKTLGFMINLCLFVAFICVAGSMALHGYKAWIDLTDPRPQWTTVGHLSYTPDRVGWTTLSTKIPDGPGQCRIVCKEGYQQYITTSNPYHINVGCRGVSSAAANGDREDQRFTFLEQLIQVRGVTHGSTTRPFPCATVVDVSVAPNVDVRDVTNFRGNKGRVVFEVQRENLPPSKS